MTIVYIDMDNVLVDFRSGIEKLSPRVLKEYSGRYDEVPGIFAKMSPYPGALDAFKWISKHSDCYILSTATWGNPSAWSDKLEWVKKYLGPEARKRLILSHHKNLMKGDIIIDDRTARGVSEFQGVHIHFGYDHITGKPNAFPSWEATIKELRRLLVG